VIGNTFNLADMSRQDDNLQWYDTDGSTQKNIVGIARITA